MHRRLWITLAVVALIVGHAGFFYYVSSHITFSVVMVSSVILLVAIKIIFIKHRGLSDALRSLFQ
jgi:hypothetical protein